jgi:hypothetical protein
MTTAVDLYRRASDDGIQNMRSPNGMAVLSDLALIRAIGMQAILDGAGVDRFRIEVCLIIGSMAPPLTLSPLLIDDEEVCKHLKALRPLIFPDLAREDCIRMFGRSRTPNQQDIVRFWRHLDEVQDGKPI